MRRQWILLIIAFLLPVQPLFSQEAPSKTKTVKRLVVKRRAKLPEVVRPLRGLVNDLIEEGEAALVAPLSFSSQDFANAAFLTGLVGITHVRDPELLGGIQKGRSSSLDFFSDAGQFIGNPVVGLGTMAALYSFDFPGKDDKLKNTLETAMHSGIIASSFVYGTQLFVQRESPEIGNYRNFHGSRFSLTHKDYKSFTSLNTAYAFSTATTFSEAYGEDLSFVPYVAYGLAALAGWSQAYENKHWVSDVFAGALLGVYTAHQVGLHRSGKATKRASQEIYFKLGSPVGLLGASAVVPL